ncbi:MAG: hypothetical protein K6E40_17590 [Desulfovibrio sp.]|nr:hypothetical protein [Desulfovibrio sp.]
MFVSHPVSGYASTVVSMLSIVLKPGSLGTLESLRSLDLLGCTRCEASIVVDPLQKKTADVFKAAGIACPHRIPLAGGRLSYTPPPALEQLQEGLCGPEAGCGAESGAPVAGAGMDGRGEGRKSRSTGAEGRKTAKAEAQSGAEVQSGAEAPPKRKPGRPKGSRNKKTLEREAKAQADAQSGAEALPKRKPGRPKGSKNKKTLEREAARGKNIQKNAVVADPRALGTKIGNVQKPVRQSRATSQTDKPWRRAGR